MSPRRAPLRWNSNPYEPDSGKDASTAQDPGAFLLAYRLAKHYRIV